MSPGILAKIELVAMDCGPTMVLPTVDVLELVREVRQHRRGQDLLDRSLQRLEAARDDASPREASHFEAMTACEEG